MGTKQNEKGRINTVILHEDPRVRGILEDVVDRNPLLYRRGSFPSMSNYDLGAIEDPSNQVVLMEVQSDPFVSTIHDKIEKAMDLQEKNPAVNIIGITPSNLHPEILRKVGKAGYAGTLTIPQSMSPKAVKDIDSEMRAYINRCILQERLTQRLNIGVVGTGEIGSNITRDLMGKRWLDKICWYTELDKEHTFDTLVRGAPTYGEEVQRVDHLDDLFSPELGMDIIIIARGRRRKDYEKKPSREAVVWEDFPYTLEMVRPVLEKIEQHRFGGNTIIFSNPPGPISQIATNFYGIPAETISSVACDATRGKGIVRNEIIGRKPSLRRHIKLDEISLQVFGEHGAGVVPYWEGASIAGERMDMFLSNEGIPFTNEDYVALTAQVRGQGEEVKQKSKKSGINPFDVSQETARALDMIAHYKQTSETLWYAQYGEHLVNAIYGEGERSPVNNPFLVSPVRMDYAGMYGKGRMAFRRGGEFNTDYVRKLPDHIKENLKQVIAAQARFIEVGAQVLGKSHQSNLKVV